MHRASSSGQQRRSTWLARGNVHHSRHRSTTYAMTMSAPNVLQGVPVAGAEKTTLWTRVRSQCRRGVTCQLHDEVFAQVLASHALIVT